MAFGRKTNRRKIEYLIVVLGRCLLVFAVLIKFIGETQNVEILKENSFA